MSASTQSRETGSGAVLANSKAMGMLGEIHTEIVPAALASRGAQVRKNDSLLRSFAAITNRTCSRVLSSNSNRSDLP